MSDDVYGATRELNLNQALPTTGVPGGLQVVGCRPPLLDVPKRGRGDPGHANSRATTQHQRELAGVMRYVAQIQEQQLADAHVVPWKSAPP